MIIDVHLTISEEMQEKMLSEFFLNFSSRLANDLEDFSWCKALDKDSIERFELIEEITREKVYSIE